MSMHSAHRLAAAALVMLFGAGAYAEDPPSLSNKWRIECSGGADSAGALQFRVTPEGGSPVNVSVRIEEGRSENGVARDIRDAFSEQLPKGSYSVETDDGEDVLIKKDLGEPNFSVELVASDVEDVRVRLDRE